jgi:hypothetical protein
LISRRDRLWFRANPYNASAQSFHTRGHINVSNEAELLIPGAVTPVAERGRFDRHQMMELMMMKTMLCAAAGAMALYAVPAGAVQPSAPLALKSADVQNVETVRSRHRDRSVWYGSRWYGAAGAYAYAPGYRSYGYSSRRCVGDENFDSANPSWKCFNARR